MVHPETRQIQYLAYEHSGRLSPSSTTVAIDGGGDSDDDGDAVRGGERQL